MIQLEISLALFSENQTNSQESVPVEITTVATPEEAETVVVKTPEVEAAVDTTMAVTVVELIPDALDAPVLEPELTAVMELDLSLLPRMAAALGQRVL